MKFLSKEEVKNKRVVLRCDFNVPVKDGIILDNTKIIRSLKTINYLLEKHFGLIYSIIIGFVIGSIPALIPNFDLSLNLIIGIITMIFSFILSYKLTK